MDLLPMYEQAIEWTGTVVAGIRGDQHGAPTPCDEWDVRTLLNHLIGGNAMWAALGAGQTVDPTAPMPDFAADDPAGAYRQTSKTALEAFRAPGAAERIFATPAGEMPGSIALGIALMDVAVHGWDLAAATGQPSELDPGIAGALLAGAKASITPDRRQPNAPFFAAEVEVGPDATRTQQLVAFLGRQP